MNLMMTKQEIEKAVEQMHKIQGEYPEFYKLHLMLLEIQDFNKELEKRLNENG